MGFSFNFFGKQEIRRFKYRPRLYDPEEEERREMFGDHSQQKKEYVPGELVRGSLRDENYKSTKDVSRNQKHMGMLTIVLLFAVVAALFKFFPVLLETAETEHQTLELLDSYKAFCEEHSLCLYGSVEKRAVKAFWSRYQNAPFTFVDFQKGYKKFRDTHQMSPFTSAEMERSFMQYWDRHKISAVEPVKLQDVYDDFWTDHQVLPMTSPVDTSIRIIDVIYPTEMQMQYVFVCRACGEKKKFSIDEWEIAEWE